MRNRAALAAFLAALTGLGCALSNSSTSSGSLSDSVSSPFESRSSASGGTDSAYLQDVREAVIALAHQGGDLDGLRRGLSSLARRHGILDWGSDALTFLAVGQGLRMAGVSRDGLSAYEAALGAGPRERAWLQQAFDRPI